MPQFRQFLLLIIGLGAAFPSSACRLVYPDPSKTDQYASIFLGIITGVHLEGLENRLLGNPDAFIDGVPVNLTGGAAPVSVTVVPASGSEELRKSAQELRIAQCRGDTPQLGAKGIFFVNPSGKSAQVVWESETVQFAKWAPHIELQANGR